VAHRVTLIPGDGIGPEVAAAAVRVLDAAGPEIEWDRRDAGAGAFERSGEALPEATVESIRERGVALKGPTGTPKGGGFRSANVELRRRLDLYAGVRPCRAFDGVRTPSPGADFVIVRMNHEDLYEGIEFPCGDAATARLRDLIAEARGVRLGDDAGISIKPLSVSATARVARVALGYARANGRRRVTVVHKATVMRATDGLFLETAGEVAAREFPEVELDDLSVDTFCNRLVGRTAEFDVVLLPIMYGDIASDLGAALIGGLGMAAGANLGDECAVFEPVHGTVPARAGTGRANPLATVLSGAMMLRHLGEGAAADRVEGAVAGLVGEGRTVTYDLRPAPDDPGAASTAEVATALVARLVA
jgi:isocitrate dehydrogenase (NAD+)